MARPWHRCCFILVRRQAWPPARGRPLQRALHRQRRQPVRAPEGCVPLAAFFWRVYEQLQGVPMKQVIASLRTGNWKTLLACFLYFDTGFTAWVMFGPLAPYISKQLSLVSHLNRVSWSPCPVLSAAIVRVTFGNLFQSVDGRRLALLGIALSSIPSLVLLFPVAPTYTLLLALGVLLGVGGASFAVALPMAGSSYPPRVQGLVLGLAAAGNVGAVIDGFVFPTLAQHYGWQHATAAALPLLLLTAAAVLLWARGSQRQERRGRARIVGVRIVARLASWRWCWRSTAGWLGTGKTGLLLLPPLGAGVALALLPARYLRRAAPARYLDRDARLQHHLRRLRRHVLLREPSAHRHNTNCPRSNAGMVMAALSFTGAMVRPVGGFLADRLSGVKVLHGAAARRSHSATSSFALQMPPLAGGGGTARGALSLLRSRQRRHLSTGAAALAGQDRIDDRPHRRGRRHRRILSAGRHGHWPRKGPGATNPGFATFGILAATALILVIAVQRQWLSWSVPDRLADLDFDASAAPLE